MVKIKKQISQKHHRKAYLELHNVTVDNKMQQSAAFW